MNTKRKLSSILPCVLLFLVMFNACTNKQNEHNHSVDHSQSANEITAQTLSPSKHVLSNQATVKLQLGSKSDLIKSQGYITLDPNRSKTVAARFGGRIEKLYVKFNNQYVKQGDKIMDIYSPDLGNFQEEHLFLFKSKNENSLIEKSREKLRLLGITENQIKQLEKIGTVALTVSVFSPANGFVFLNPQSAEENTTAKNTSGMNAMAMQQNTSSGNSFAASTSQFREGMYVNEGQELFTVNDLQEVWALVSVSNQYANQIHENQSVEITPENDLKQIIKGNIASIEQTFEEGNQRFERVRIVLPNATNFLKINSLITAQFKSSNNEKLQVPSSAVYKTGLNAYVFVKTDTTQKGTGIFQLRKVIASTSNNGMTTIKSGLLLNEEIAKEAGLMADSETFLNAN